MILAAGGHATPGARTTLSLGWRHDSRTIDRRPARSGRKRGRRGLRVDRSRLCRVPATGTGVRPGHPECTRLRADAVPAVDAVAEDLPFGDRFFDAALASFTVHQWRDLRGGLRELRRVAAGPVVILTCDPTALAASWLDDYAPEVIATEAGRYPAIADLCAGLGGTVTVEKMPIPLACADGFSEAYYGRPEALLDPGARRANSAWSFVGRDVEDRFERTLRADLASGRWDERNGRLRTQPTFDGSLRLLVGRP